MVFLPQMVVLPQTVIPMQPGMERGQMARSFLLIEL
jgi:hypothetical protein